MTTVTGQRIVGTNFEWREYYDNSIKSRVWELLLYKTERIKREASGAPSFGNNKLTIDDLVPCNLSNIKAYTGAPSPGVNWPQQQSLWDDTGWKTSYILRNSLSSYALNSEITTDTLVPLPDADGMLWINKRNLTIGQRIIPYTFPTGYVEIDRDLPGNSAVRHFDGTSFTNSSSAVPAFDGTDCIVSYLAFAAPGGATIYPYRQATHVVYVEVEAGWESYSVGWLYRNGSFAIVTQEDISKTEVPSSGWYEITFPAVCGYDIGHHIRRERISDGLVDYDENVGGIYPAEPAAQLNYWPTRHVPLMHSDDIDAPIEYAHGAILSESY
jgi:hypothetical protein